MLLVGMSWLCGSWSVAGHNHRKVIGQDPICADMHGMAIGLSGNGWAETRWDKRDGRYSIIMDHNFVCKILLNSICQSSIKLSHHCNCCYAVVTCEIKSFQNYFSLCQCQTGIILFQCVETCLKLFQNYPRSLTQLMNTFQHVECRLSKFSGWNNSISFSDAVRCELKHLNNFKIISK